MHFMFILSLKDVPTAPGKPTISEIQRSSVFLSWQPPKSDGNSPITGYIIEKRETTSTRWFRANREDVSGTNHTVINLIEDSEYEFRVLAENKAGFSPASEASQRVVVKDPRGG